MMSLNVSKTELIAKALDQVDVNFLILNKNVHKQVSILNRTFMNVFFKRRDEYHSQLTHKLSDPSASSKTSNWSILKRFVNGKRYQLFHSY